MKELATITPQPIVRMCWVVDDMEASAQQWVGAMRAGPFCLVSHIQLSGLTYRGKPAKLDQASSVGQRGTTASRVEHAALQ